MEHVWIFHWLKKKKKFDEECSRLKIKRHQSRASLRKFVDRQISVVGLSRGPWGPYLKNNNNNKNDSCGYNYCKTYFVKFNNNYKLVSSGSACHYILFGILLGAWPNSSLQLISRSAESLIVSEIQICL